MSSITSSLTIDALRGLFAAYGIPEEVVSDNGPQLLSAEFTDFLKGNGIKHTQVPAYHPALNGAVERSVQILKHSLLKSVCEKQGKQMLSLKHKLANFLIMYRSTPHSVTGKTPSELFLKRHIRTRFTLLKPDLAKSVQEKQQVPHAWCGRNPNSNVTEDNSDLLNFPTVGDCSMPVIEPKSPENTENLTAQDPWRATPAVETVHRYPQRIRTAPKRLDL